MDNKQLIKISRKIVALDANRLRSLQEKYDAENEVFEDVISAFEELSDIIESDSEIEQNRSFWDKLIKNFDPEEISEEIITYIASGLFVRALKLLEQLSQAENNRQQVLEKFENDAELEKKTKKELLALLKEIRKERKLLNNFDKIKQDLLTRINAMAEKTEKLKKNSNLKDIATNKTIKDYMSEIKDLFNQAADIINTDNNIGETQDDINKLNAGQDKIKNIIKEGRYVREQSKTNDSNPSHSNGSIQQKLTSLESDSSFNVDEIKTMLANFSNAAGAKITGDIKTKLESNKNIIVTQTGKSETEIEDILNKKLYDDPSSIKQTIQNDVNELNNLLDANKLNDFYNKIKEISREPNNYFKLPAFNQLFNEFGKKSQLKDLLIDSFKQYDCKSIIDEIKTKFEEIVNNYNPVSLRVTTASIQKIASKITKDIMTAGYYSWNNPNDKLQNFIDLLLELVDALEKNDIKRIKKILENKVGNYGQTILLTKELYDRLMNIIDAIEKALNEHKDDFDGKSFANDIKRLAKDIEKIYF